MAGGERHAWRTRRGCDLRLFRGVVVGVRVLNWCGRRLGGHCLMTVRGFGRVWFLRGIRGRCPVASAQGRARECGGGRQGEERHQGHESAQGHTHHRSIPPADRVGYARGRSASWSASP